MRIEVVRNFLTSAECNQLTALTEYGKTNNLLTLGAKTEVRYTSRLDPDLYQYPQSVIDISNRVRAYCGVSNYPLIFEQGRNGIVTNYTPPTGDVSVHTDSRSPDGLAALRCNVVTRQADLGGVLFIGGQEVPLAAGDLHCYLVSEYEHYVTPVEGNTVRVNWIFGAYVPAEAWESGQIVVGG
jgi:hypothetical protein